MLGPVIEGTKGAHKLFQSEFFAPPHPKRPNLHHPPPQKKKFDVSYFLVKNAKKGTHTKPPKT